MLLMQMDQNTTGSIAQGQNLFFFLEIERKETTEEHAILLLKKRPQAFENPLPAQRAHNMGRNTSCRRAFRRHL